MDIYFLALAMLLLLAGGVMAWAVLRRQRRGLYSMYETPLPLERVWAEWLDAPGESDAERARRRALYSLATPVHRDAVRDDLLRFEQQALTEPEPLLAIRRELMDSIDRRMINREILALPENLRQRLREQSGDVIATDAEAEAYLAANELRLEVLREYAARRFGDRAAQDWFVVYERAAVLKQRTARNYIMQSMSGSLTKDSDARHQAINLVDSQLRTHLLKVVPGTRFEKLDDGKSA
ncbi:MAG TPA: hypothetical protein VF267_09475 [Gammaproteobacteria bacterium]